MGRGLFMLFNSVLFIFCFLPVVLAGFYLLLNRVGVRAGFGWLVLASLFFYGWWNPPYILLLLFLMTANFYCARKVSVAPGSVGSKYWLAFGVGINLCVLAFFKYTDFFIGTVNTVAGSQWPLLHIMLPLAISFFTFQKIAFLVDCYRGVAREDGFLNYVLFVSFFPQLIAGPIVHYNEIMPQFRKPGFMGADARMMAMGLSLFAIGLFKKAVLADCVAIPADMVYGAAESASAITTADAWGGAFAYSLQIYFDFSGYSDMAIGLALMFGVRLPDNFLSPYQATGMIEFWRRWHITLSRFLRDYLYIPLGGNRVSKARQSFNVVVTMLLGGLWHGASWNFVLWGGLHGAVIAINHGLRAMAGRMGLSGVLQILPYPATMAWKGVCIVLTFTVVTLLWVFFRAETLQGAIVMLSSLFGASTGAGAPLLAGSKYFAFIAMAAGIALFLPNSMRIMFDPAFALRWRPSLLWAGIVTGLFLLGVMFVQSHLGKQFIYFDF